MPESKAFNLFIALWTDNAASVQLYNTFFFCQRQIMFVCTLMCSSRECKKVCVAVWFCYEGHFDIFWSSVFKAPVQWLTGVSQRWPRLWWRLFILWTYQHKSLAFLKATVHFKAKKMESYSFSLALADVCSLTKSMVPRWK